MRIKFIVVLLISLNSISCENRRRYKQGPVLSNEDFKELTYSRNSRIFEVSNVRNSFKVHKTKYSSQNFIWWYSEADIKNSSGTFYDKYSVFFEFDIILENGRKIDLGLGNNLKLSGDHFLTLQRESNNSIWKDNDVKHSKERTGFMLSILEYPISKFIAKYHLIVSNATNEEFKGIIYQEDVTDDFLKIKERFQ